MIIFLEFHHGHNQMLQLWFADDSSDAKDEEELIEVENVSIIVSESSGGGDFVMVGFFHI